MKSFFFTAQDGAKLHVACWGEKNDALPIICLAGLTRNFNDFAKLALELKRRVYAFDYRGRGHSDFKQPYIFLQEAADILLCLNQLNITKAIFIGTSRGGLHILQLPPVLIKASVLNDIGAEIEIGGLLKIKAAVAKRDDAPANYNEAVHKLKAMLEDEFPQLANEDWHFLAQSVWFEENQQLKLSYDPALTQSLDTISENTKLPTAWNEFDVLAQKPCLIIRGEHSQLLSKSTFNRMKSLNNRTKGIEIKGQGHAPIMSGGVNAAIIDFIENLG